jgi:hypothetical protein
MNILLIDSNVTDYQIIVESCNINTLPFVYSYHSTRDEISKIFSYISHKINRIGIFADQNAKKFLDDELFFVENENTLILSDNTNFMVQLINDYDISYIDYFACNTLNDPNWVNYFEILMSLTNVIVGASNNETGNIQYGGDWVMESTCENVELIYFTKNIEYYKYLLAITGFNVRLNSASYDDITNLFNAGSATGLISTSGFVDKRTNNDMISTLSKSSSQRSTFTATNYYINYLNAIPPNYIDVGAFLTEGVAELPTPSGFTITPTGGGTLAVQSPANLYFFENNTYTIKYTPSGNRTIYILLYASGGNGSSSGGGGSNGAVVYAQLTLITGTLYTLTVTRSTNSFKSPGTTINITGSNGINATGSTGGEQGSPSLTKTRGSTGTPPGFYWNGKIGINANGAIPNSQFTSITTARINTTLYNAIKTRHGLSSTQDITTSAGGNGSAGSADGINYSNFPSLTQDSSATSAPYGCGGAGSLSSTNIGGSSCAYIYFT